jgi:hypothetical protein
MSSQDQLLFELDVASCSTIESWSLHLLGAVSLPVAAMDLCSELNHRVQLEGWAALVRAFSARDSGGQGLSFERDILSAVQPLISDTSSEDKEQQRWRPCPHHAVDVESQ